MVCRGSRMVWYGMAAGCEVCMVWQQDEKYRMVWQQDVKCCIGMAIGCEVWYGKETGFEVSVGMAAGCEALYGLTE